MSVSSGILHSEKNNSWRLQGGEAHTEPVHFVQMWVVPDEDGIRPGYEQLEIENDALAGGFVPVASGMAQYADRTAIRIKNRYAALHVARLQPGKSAELPDAPYLHLFVAKGRVRLEGAGDLETGDEVRFNATGGQGVTAIEADLTPATRPPGFALPPAEILVWEMHATLGH